MKKEYNFELENKFFQQFEINRASKIYFQIELFIKTLHVKGDICEFGVFKANSLTRLILLRDIYVKNKKIFAYDTFKIIKPKKKDLDFKKYKTFINKSKNYQPNEKILKASFKKRNMFKNVKLIKGDVMKTFPNSLSRKISFALMDLDLYEPTAHVLKYVWSKLNKGGVILLDNYKVFKGETKAVDEFVKKKGLKIYSTKRYRTFYFLIK